jgi:hypothetical protein
VSDFRNCDDLDNFLDHWDVYIHSDEIKENKRTVVFSLGGDDFYMEFNILPDGMTFDNSVIISMSRYCDHKGEKIKIWKKKVRKGTNPYEAGIHGN